ncbi:MAG: PhoH family protein [Firmicutes bacterium]|nr:PhoH family protein [Alicyclobacillaceae bacterium]MCL6496936.1 PhoH family protein [Bacillota bacterium]
MPLTQWAIADNRAATTLFGHGDEHLRLIEERLAVKLTARGNTIAIAGSLDGQNQAREVLDLLAEWVAAGELVSRHTVETAIRAVREGAQVQFLHLLTESILTTTQGKVVRPKTLGQQRYVEAIRKRTLVFGMGPAGTGKTFLAMAMAVQALRAHAVERIVLTRPAVEAGEKLGFLPGDLEDKVDPYLRPLYDALYELLGPEATEKYRERGHIEIAPLAYMRGRTLNQSFVILDEAQNTSYEQMKMFLTRLGQGSRMVVTGDQTQVDLPAGHISGLAAAARILAGLEDVEVVQLTERDVVRHPLVARIIAAYERAEAGEAGDVRR